MAASQHEPKAGLEEALRLAAAERWASARDKLSALFAAGLPQAEYALSRMKILGLGRDPEVASGLEMLASAADKDFPPALLAIGAAHALGIGGRTDWAEAKENFVRALAKGTLRAVREAGIFGGSGP